MFECECCAFVRNSICKFKSSRAELHTKAMRVIYALIAAACAIAGWFVSNGDGANARNSIGLSGFAGTALTPELAASATSLRNEHRAMFSDDDSESPCWIQTLDYTSLKGCDDFADHEARSRVALIYAACHLHKTGRSAAGIGSCSRGQSVAACIPRMSDAAQSVFDGFFRQIETVCLVAKASRFQRTIQALVEELYRAASSGSEYMLGFHRQVMEMGEVLGDTQRRVEQNLLTHMNDENSRHLILMERGQQYARTMDDAFHHAGTSFSLLDIDLRYIYINQCAASTS
jgi:hypothetical protein